MPINASDFNKLKALPSYWASRGNILICSILNEVLNVVDKVTSWEVATEKGNLHAACCYDQNTGMASSYHVRYEQGNIDNLVHELTHVAVNEAYLRDFVNYKSDWGGKDTQKPEYTGDGRRRNEEERQGKWMDDTKNKTNNSNLSILKSKTSQIDVGEIKNFLSTKCEYGITCPHKEYDTVLNQMLTYTHLKVQENPTTIGKNETIGAFWKELNKYCKAAYDNRQNGIKNGKDAQVNKSLYL